MQKHDTEKHMPRLAWTRTVPGMEAFDDWQTMDTAPKDGTRFLGAVVGTGNVYETWYDPKWYVGTREEDRKLETAWVWWCQDDRDPNRVTSLMPTHWRPKSV